MKMLLGVLVVVSLVAVYTPVSHAGGGPVVIDTPTVARDLSSYRSDVGDKAARGIKNILFGWTELPKQIVDVTQESNPIWGLLAGGFQGSLKAMARTVSGVSDVVTAPIAPEKKPFINPDIDVD